LCVIRAAALSGWRIAWLEDGRGRSRRRNAASAVEARSAFLNPAGVVQGGFLAAMLDETFSPAVAARLQPDEFPVTLEMKISFVAPARMGTLIGEARVVNQGKSICFLEGKLSDLEGRLVATGTATALVPRKRSDAAD
jgi:uncharacterized protein (TIGR00369 family)